MFTCVSSSPTYPNSVVNSSAIRDMLRLEAVLDDCLERLKERCGELQQDVDLTTDDLDSIASSTTSITQSQRPPSSISRVVRFAKQDREVEKLRLKMSKFEQENMMLRQQVEEMQKLLAMQTNEELQLVSNEDEEKKQEDKEIDQHVPSEITEGQVPSVITEGQVLSLMHHLDSDEDVTESTL